MRLSNKGKDKITPTVKNNIEPRYVSKCRLCNRDLKYTGKYISILLQNGNEELLSLCYCKYCKKYYIEGYEDVFISPGDEDKYWLYGPYDEKDGEKFTEKMSQCKDPGNKFCECEAHMYFRKFIYGEGG